MVKSDGPDRKKTRKVAVALPAMETAPERWLRTIRLSGFAFTILALIVLSLVVLAPSLRTLVDQQQQISALKKANEEKQAAVDDLTDQVARWDDPAYIEAQARSRIYYVYPGEYTYLVINADKSDGEAATVDGAPISDEIQTTKVDWLQSLLSSVVTSGVTDATPEELDK